MIGWKAFDNLLRDPGADSAAVDAAGKEAAWESIHFPAIHVLNSWRVWQEAILREADARSSVGGSGLAYDAGGLGVRVQTTPANTFEKGMVELVDAGAILRRARVAYAEAEADYISAVSASGLSERERDVLMLRYLRGGLSYSNIAARCGFRTTSGARKAVMRAEEKWIETVYERAISPVLRWVEERKENKLC